MKRIRLLFIGILVLTVACAQPDSAGIGTPQFEQLMQTVAAGWNEGNARKATDCFTDNAIYTEPPDRQVYRGRAQLFEFFGGDRGRASSMKMTWHHLTFNEGQQVGAGEFTFEYGGKVHGMVLVKISDGKISNWREYWYESDLDWGQVCRREQILNLTSQHAKLKDGRVRRIAMSEAKRQPNSNVARMALRPGMGAKEDWLRGLDLNQRPLGYESSPERDFNELRGQGRSTTYRG